MDFKIFIVTAILLGVFLFIIIILIIIVIFLFVKKNKKINVKKDDLNKEKINNDLAKLNILKDQYQKEILNYQNKLKQLSKLDEKQIANEHKTLIYEEIIPQVNKDVKEYIDSTWETANEKAAEILVETMERISKPLIQDKTTTNIEIPDDSIKAKIIGKEGRNKKNFENIAGVDLIIEKDSNIITISSPNPIRRELTLRTLKKVFASKSIEFSKIEAIFQEETNKFNEENFKYAKDVILEELNITFPNEEIYKYLGRMKYRSSYGQNTLNHIIECAKIAAAIAESLNLDKTKAAKAALLHDIGKSMDYELDMNHVDLGVEIAKNLGLEDYIINAIQSHHDEVVANNIYSQITKIADLISASRPGARINSFSEYFERVQELENIINQFDEVNSCYAIRSGRNLRVIANPTKLKHNSDLEILAYKIKKAIENNPIVRKYKIKVVIIKENRFEFETSNAFSD